MKKLLLLSSLCSMFAFAPVYAVEDVAQDIKAAQHEEKVQQREARFINRMTQELALTSDQANQIKTIMSEQRAKAQAVRVEGKQRIEAVLTPEQVAKFKQMKQHSKKDGAMASPN
jgi:Spy/CpxP family protein refolding chaperone